MKLFILFTIIMIIIFVKISQKRRREKMKRVNIGLEENVHTQAKIIAIMKKVPLSKYLESCIGKATQSDQKILEK